MKLLKLYFITSRPIFWILAPLAFISGAIFNNYDTNFIICNPVMLLQLFSLSFPFSFYTFGINDIVDYDADLANPRKSGSNRLLVLLEGARIDQNDHSVIRKGIVICGIIILAVSSLTLNPANLFFTISLLIISFTYSSYPWHLKSRPPLDSIAAGLGSSFLPFATGYTYTANPWDMPFEIFIFSIGVMSIHSFTTIMDFTADRLNKTKSFAVKFGKRTASAFPAAAMIFALMVAETKLIRSLLVFNLILFIINTLFSSEKLARITYIILYIVCSITTFIWITLNL